MFPHTYDFIVHLPYDKNDQLYINTPGALYMIPPDLHYSEVNLALGVLPWEQAFVVNTMLPGSIQASSTHGTRADLMNNLNNGCPTIITIALPGLDIGHVLVVIGYDPKTQQFLFFVPAVGKKQNENQIIESWNYDRGFTSFDELWAAKNQFINSNSMVTLSKKSPIPLISFSSSYKSNICNYR